MIVPAGVEARQNAKLPCGRTSLARQIDPRLTPSGPSALSRAPRAAVGRAVVGRAVRKILIVDRSPADCAAVRQLLSKHGTGEWHFAEAVKGEEALAVAASPPSCDCIIFNDRLPDMDSAEFLEKLRERLGTPEIVTVVLSSEGDEPLSVRAIKSGAADCLPKAHLNSELLFRAVENAVSRQQLAQTQERLHLAYDAAGIAPWDWNLAANTTTWTPALLLLHGLNPDEAGELSVSWLDRVCPMDRARVQQAVADWLARGETFYDEYRIERPDGALRWVSVKGKVLRVAAGKPVHAIGVTTDITERKESDEDLHRTNDRLQLFADAASHDLQSPANIIGTLTDLLAEKYRGRDAEGDRVIDLIASSAQRLKTLITDLLAYARASGSEEPSLVTAVAALEAAMVDLGPAMEEAGAVIVYRDLPPEIQTKLHLRQIFQNLIGNSIKYRRPEEAPRIEIAGRLQDTDWVISVKDNGQGFSPEYAEAIFLPFQRLHGREYPGSGIGLATCRKLLECNGGSIRAVSKPGEGSTFGVTFPVVH